MLQEFPLDESIVYLNHAAVSPWPSRTSEAVERFARENARFGAAHYPDWMKTEEKLRTQLAWLINAPSADDISLLKNTSEGLSTVAYGVRWQPGDNVVSFKQEFPSNRVVWESLSSLGVETRLVDIESIDNPEQALIERCNERTRLVSSSSVQYANGLRMDLERIGAYCRRNDILFCVDAIQSLGAIPFDVQRVQADFVTADGHKWMLGPEGVALFYCRESIRDSLQLNQFGWHMLARAGDFENTDWSSAQNGKRFECGSSNMLGIHALSASLDLLMELGMEKVYQQLMQRNELLLNLIEESPALFELLSNKTPMRRSGIVSFKIRGADQQAAYRELMRKGVICACRGGGIRLSPHFYTPLATIERTWRIIVSLAQDTAN